jgi:hypothetical protein
MIDMHLMFGCILVCPANVIDCSSNDNSLLHHSIGVNEGASEFCIEHMAHNEVTFDPPDQRGKPFLALVDVPTYDG